MQVRFEQSQASETKQKSLISVRSVIRAQMRSLEADKLLLKPTAQISPLCLTFSAHCWKRVERAIWWNKSQKESVLARKSCFFFMVESWL